MEYNLNVKVHTVVTLNVLLQLFLDRCNGLSVHTFVLFISKIQSLLDKLIAFIAIRNFNIPVVCTWSEFVKVQHNVFVGSRLSVFANF